MIARPAAAPPPMTGRANTISQAQPVEAPAVPAALARCRLGACRWPHGRVGSAILPRPGGPVLLPGQGGRAGLTAGWAVGAGVGRCVGRRIGTAVGTTVGAGVGPMVTGGVGAAPAGAGVALDPGGGADSVGPGVSSGDGDGDSGSGLAVTDAGGDAGAGVPGLALGAPDAPGD
jgi:hypothetical protein